MNTFSFKNKALYAESVAVTDLMAEYGSPLYIYSRGQIESNWQQFDQAFGDHPHLICYAVKANSNLGVLNVLAKLGSGFDIVSIGELERVIAAGGPYIATGLKENKFGVSFDRALALYKKAEFSKHLDVFGLDYHIGSQITEVSPFIEALEKALDLISQLKAEGIKMSHIDIGGGVGIAYNEEETINIEKYVQSVLDKVGDLEVILEPGRAIVGNAGIFVTQVEYLKQSGVKSFAIIDGAMNDLQRPSLYGSYHKAIAVEDNSKGIKDTWDLVGPICETGDFLAKDRELTLAQGDYIALMSAGAYGFVLSSNYNSRPRVAEVMVSGSNHTLVRKRETVGSLFENEFIFNNEIN